MNINQYTARLKIKELPIDFNHQKGEEYDSSFDYVKETFSNYHFDKFREETSGEWYHKLGRYVGDFSADVGKIIEKSKELEWDQVTKQGLRNFPGGISPMDRQEENDRIRHGVKNSEHTNVVLEEYLNQLYTIKTMIDYWELENATYRAHVQLPGQTFAPHIDKLWHRCPSDPGRIVRMIINLADWEMGQYIIFGNSVYSQWHAGDVTIFDHHNLPHATINISSKPRPNIVLTGLRTKETDRKLESASPASRYQIS